MPHIYHTKFLFMSQVSFIIKLNLILHFYVLCAVEILYSFRYNKKWYKYNYNHLYIQGNFTDLFTVQGLIMLFMEPLN